MAGLPAGVALALALQFGIFWDLGAQPCLIKVGPDALKEATVFPLPTLPRALETLQVNLLCRCLNVLRRRGSECICVGIRILRDPWYSENRVLSTSTPAAWDS